MARGKVPQQKKTPGGPSVFESMSPTTIDALCLVFLYAVTVILFRAIIFNNASFEAGGDTAAALSYAHAGIELQKSEGSDVLWMPYFFSGMPTFGNVAFVPRNVNYIQTYAQEIVNLLYLNGRWTWYIVYFLVGGISMFFLVRRQQMSRAAALLAALTFMLSPFAMGLPTEGHGSKLMAVSYLPLVFLLTQMLFEKRSALSFGLLTAALGTLLLTNHMQIVYYEFIILGLYLLFTIVTDVRTDRAGVVTKTGLLVAALLIAFAISSYIYLSVYEYAQFSMRGGGTAGSTGGLAYDYATNWSFSIWEAIVFLIPGFYGIGGAQNPYYWGHVEPWNNSNFYVGLIPIILTVFALRYRRTRLAIFMSVVTIVVLLISLGRNLPYIYEAMFAVLPFFNKFRAPLMILHMLPFTLGILGAIGLDAVISIAGDDKEASRLIKPLMIIAGTAAGLWLISLFLKDQLQQSLSAMMFLRDGEAAQLQQQYGARASSAVTQIKAIRFDIFWKDYTKFLFLTAASVGVIALFFRKKFGEFAFTTLVVGIALADLWIIDAKHIEPHPANAAEQTFQMDPTIRYLKEQPGLFRVFPLGQSLFSDNTFAYFGLQSLGGYSPAKLKIYQTMIDSCLYHGPDPSFPLNMAVVNMLNTRYIIAQGRLPEEKFTPVNIDQQKREITYSNPGALPRAFFVRDVVIAHDDHDVFSAMNSASFDPSKTAVLYKDLPQSIAQSDSPRADLTEFAARRIAFKSHSGGAGLLVLSEIYYPAGWKAFIDGTETEIFRTNYILRSVLVPAGDHEVVFSFDPPLYAIGWTLSNIGWGLAAIFIIVGVFRLPLFRRILKRAEPASPAPSVPA